MVRECAESGDGFNLDEFCPEHGHLLHKFIHQPRVLVATDIQGQISGAAIFGFSSLPRVVGSLYIAYFIVKPSQRRQGIATELLTVVSELAQQNGSDVLLFDVFANNSAGLNWLHSCGFQVCASLPYCGYVDHRGFSHSLLMFKVLRPTQRSC